MYTYIYIYIYIYIYNLTYSLSHTHTLTLPLSLSHTHTQHRNSSNKALPGGNTQPNLATPPVRGCCNIFSPFFPLSLIWFPTLDRT